jgi:hypothetical protein
MVRPVEIPTPNPQKPSIVLKNPIFLFDSKNNQTHPNNLFTKIYQRICMDKEIDFKKNLLLYFSDPTLINMYYYYDDDRLF